jgi:hypothetical protein
LKKSRFDYSNIGSRQTFCRTFSLKIDGREDKRRRLQEACGPYPIALRLNQAMLVFLGMAVSPKCGRK